MSVAWVLKCSVALGLLLAAAGSAVCHAEDVCPWMNRATASGVLDGEAGPAEVGAVADVSSCDFRYLKDGETLVLSIRVAQMKDRGKEFPAFTSECGEDKTILRAIGNEAAMCPFYGAGNTRGERVVGRVRLRAFVVTLSTNAHGGKAMPREILREKVKLVAEQLAGALF